MPKFLNPIVASATIDLQKTELQNARVQNLGTPPSSPVTGQLYYSTAADSTLNKLYYWNGTAWIAADGSTLLTYGSPASSAVVDTSVDGVATSVARSDHKHAREGWGSAPAVTHGIGQAAVLGSASTSAKSDHVHPVAASAAPASSGVGDTVVTGSATTFAASDHKHAREAFATPTIALGTAGAAGSLATLIKSDATIAAFDATAPTTSVPGDAAVVGAVNFAARRDHAHGREAVMWKAPVRAATTTSGTLATSFENGDVIDGVTLVTNDRILIKDQGDANNGIYTVNASGAPTRATDADASAEVISGMAVSVSEGTANADTVWMLTTNGTITLGSTSLTFGVVGSGPGSTPVQIDIGDAQAAGSANTFARNDHQHAFPAGSAPAVTEAPGTAAALGSATTAAKSDHVHPMAAAGAPAASAVTSTQVTGAAGTFADSAHVHAREGFGTTQDGTTFGTSFAGGSAATVSRGDHQHGTPAHAAAAHAAIKLSDLTAATADYSMGGFKLTNVAAPIASTDAANKAYVDSVSAGLDPKASVKMATTATPGGTYNNTGGTSGRGQMTSMPNTAIDGVALVALDRVLVKDHSTGAANGIWVITTVGSGANGVWDRATDFDQDAEVTDGSFFFVEQGTANGDSGWVLSTNNVITIGGASGTALTFVQFSGAGQITAGTGLTKSGNTLNAVAGATPSSGGAGGGLVANADDLVIDTNVVVRKFAASIGDGSTLNYVVTHNLNTQDVHVAVRDNSSPYAFMYPDMEATAVNTCTIKFAVAPTTNQYRVIVQA